MLWFEWRVLAIADHGVGGLTDVNIHKKDKGSMHGGSPASKPRWLFVKDCEYR